MKLRSRDAKHAAYVQTYRDDSSVLRAAWVQIWISWLQKKRILKRVKKGTVVNIPVSGLVDTFMDTRQIIQIMIMPDWLHKSMS